MEGLLILFLIVWAINSKSSKKKKKQSANKRQTAKRTVVFEEAPVLTPQDEETKEGDSFMQNVHSGSLGFETTEGVDLCDPELGHAREVSGDPESVYAGEIGKEPILDTSPRALVQGVVMSEILARPAGHGRR